MGTFILGSNRIFFNKATFYRFLALFFSATEAIFIKKIILLTNIETAFLYWAFAGLIFASFFALISKHSLSIQKKNLKYQLFLVISIALMQYSTNFVFSQLYVAYSLALFQLSTLVSVLFGVKIFKEENLIKKMIASLIMLFGAIIIIIF